MKVETMETAKFNELDEVIALFQSIYNHRKAHPTTLSDELYYELLLTYFQRIRSAKENGKYLASYSIVVPTEILYAMDIVPMGLEFAAMLLPSVLNKTEEALSVAKGYGLLPEVCSAHRCVAAIAILGWLPRPDFVIWSNMVCDNTVKGGDIVVDRYKSVPHFIDVPYRYNERTTQYLTQELEDMVKVLEEHTHKKLDWDRLSEAVEYTRQSVELQNEINELRKAVPSPSRNRQSFQILMANWSFAGAPEGVTYLTAIRDEMKERVEAKKGYVPQEKFRILTLFIPQLSIGMKLLDWMEKEHSAVMVGDPSMSHWGEVEIDPSKPLESLAKKSFAFPVCNQMLGPFDQHVIDYFVQDAIDYKAEGAIYYAHSGCRQGCATIRVIKDALKKEVGIPTLTVDMDYMDPTYTSEEEMRDKLEGFFELLEDRK